METIEFLQGIFEAVTYKPGCTFSVEEHDNQVAIIMSRMAPDTRHPDELATVRFTQLFDKNVLQPTSEKEFVESVLYSVIRDAELHEIDEWFRFNGKCVHEPHPENPVRH